MYNQGPIPQNTQPSAPSTPAPVQPTPASQPAPQPQPQAAPKRITSPSIPIVPIIIVIVIILVAGGGYIFFKGSISKSSTTISSTALQTNVSAISNCVKISNSGKYFVTASFKTSITSGACINVTSNNVNIICNSNKITGSGPFVGIPPFTYAVEINGRNNVTVSGCTLRNFSYGIFAASSNNLNINKNNLSINYMSNIYLNNTHNSKIQNNYLSKSSSTQGSMFLTNNTSGTLIINNTVQYNQYYGINVNASNNTFQKNYINGTEYSFRCSAPNGFVISDKAFSNTCYNNTGCGFVVCKGVNTPANLSKIILKGTVNSCGSIKSPGSYQFASNINMGQFINISNPFSIPVPCIAITGKNVKLDCKGFGITNASTAISVLNSQNLTLENCNVKGAKIVGIVMTNTTSAHLSNISLVNDSLGIELFNTSISTFTNINASRNAVGFLISASFANIFQQINAAFNNYGVFLQSSSFSNTFNKDLMFNNSKIDVYATPDSANATYDLMQATGCGYTNAVWASCKHYVVTTLPYVPVSTCEAINAPGNYLLTTSLLNVMRPCLHINSKNVVFSCANRTISAAITGIGPGLAINNSNNVTINNCDFAGFTSSINVSNSSSVNFNTLNIQNTNLGIDINKGNNVYLHNSQFNNTANVSIFLYHVSASRILNNTMTFGQPRSVGIIINGSQNNTVLNNSVSRNYVGMELTGTSLNNTIRNNTMQLSTNVDYMCIGNGAVNSEKGGINYGTTKSGCKWLAVITAFNPTPSCGVAQQPTLFFLSQDAQYTTGGTCFNAYANSSTTTINCNGHTVIATNGGTFASFISSQSSRIENCVLKGFSNTIKAFNSSITVFNNTILENTSSDIAISVSNSKNGASVLENNVSALNTGIKLSNLGAGALNNNFVINSNTAYTLSNVTDLSIRNNTAYTNTNNGLIITNSTVNFFQNNNFLSSGLGLLCLFRSQGSLNNTDQGNNACSLFKNCLWIKSSLGSCP